MLEKITYNEILKEIDFSNIDYNQMYKIGRKLGLHYKDNKVVELNFNRGPLLSALISKFKPQNILEFGTGGGFATMCMASALENNGRIFTIDILDNKKSWLRAIDWGEENKISIEEKSNYEVWSKTMPKKWQNKIKTLTGYSAQVMSNNSFPKIDFAFIDGAHFYDGVKHDFISFLINSNEKFNVLFDDYIDLPSYGVKQFINNEVSKWFDVKLIYTDPQYYLFKNQKTNNKEYGMCLISSDSLKLEKKEIIKENENFIKKYMIYEKRMRFRERLNEKIPFLKNRKLSWWK